MMGKKGIVAIALVGVLASLALGPSFLWSRVWSNVGMVALGKALAAGPDAATLAAETKALAPRVQNDPARLRIFHLAVRPGLPDVAQLGQAERYLTAALRWDRSNGSAHRGLGWVWETRGDLEMAAAEWTEGGFREIDFVRCEAVATMIGWRTEIERWKARTRALVD